MIMGRIAALNPELFQQAAAEAAALYREQIGHQHPLIRETDAGGNLMLLYPVKWPDGMPVLYGYYTAADEAGGGEGDPPDGAA
jgi:hypothetical protein